jgi:hypothetical protein
MSKSYFKNLEQFTDRALIESILASFFILDYGIVQEVNGDNTINVVHAKKLTMLDGTVLPPMETKNIEVLTLSGAGFSVVWDIQKGDKVLLLGLKTLIENSAQVDTPEKSASNLHYSRETLKAFPLCAFNDEAKVRVQIKDGSLSLTANDAVTAECKNYKLSASQNAELECQKYAITAKEKIELNGNAKQFVTWAELNAALTQFLTLLNTHTHTCTAPASPTSPPIAPMTIDISAAKTTTVVTGG